MYKQSSEQKGLQQAKDTQGTAFLCTLSALFPSRIGEADGTLMVPGCKCVHDEGMCTWPFLSPFPAAASTQWNQWTQWTRESAPDYDNAPQGHPCRSDSNAATVAGGYSISHGSFRTLVSGKCRSVTRCALHRQLQPIPVP